MFPKRVGINLLSAHSGAGITANLQLLKALCASDNRFSFFIFISHSQQELIHDLPSSCRVVLFSLDSRRWVFRLFLDQIVLPICVFLMKLDILYSSGTVSFLAPCKIVLCLESANPFSCVDFPWSWRQRVRNQLLKYAGLFSSQRAHAVRFVSENSKQIICRLLRLPESKAKVIPHGWDSAIPAQEARSRPRLHEGPYILVVSNLGPYKNLHRFMRAFDHYVEKFKSRHALIVIGEPICSRYYREILQLRTRLRHGSKIKLMGKINFNELTSYYTHAEMLAYPSLEETFGLPILEALSLDVPVAASDCRGLDQIYFNPFPELFGDAIRYFNPLSVTDMSQTLEEIIGDSHRREKTGSMRKILEKYGWRKSALSLQELFSGLDGN